MAYMNFSKMLESGRTIVFDMVRIWFIYDSDFIVHKFVILYFYKEYKSCGINQEGGKIWFLDTMLDSFSVN